MVRRLRILVGTFRSTVRTRRELALENLALRQQLAVWKARRPRPRVTEMDRTARQLIEACGQEDSPRYLIRDRDQVYGERLSRQAGMLDIRETVIAARSPWQNAYAERVIGSIRRECLDHVVVVGERHLLGILSKYVDYYNETRTHLSLAKDAPEWRSVQPPSQGRVVEVPRVGGVPPKNSSGAINLHSAD
jgi:transposase InsO family protein